MSIPDIYSILSSIKHDPHNLSRYYRFIEACLIKNKDLPEGTYTEKHHICPQGGMYFPQYKNLKLNPWNLAKLTGRQHVISHRMLWKAYGGGMTLAYMNMMRREMGSKLTTRQYEQFRIELSRSVSEMNKNRIVTDEMRQKNRVRMTGKKFQKTLKGEKRIYTREEMHRIVEGYRSTRGVQRASIRKRCIDLYDQCIEHSIKILGYEPENFAIVVNCLAHDSPPKCKNCDNPVGIKLSDMKFKAYCSEECHNEYNKDTLVEALRKANSDPEIIKKSAEARRKTSLERYGVEHANQSKAGREKLSKSIKKHYAENPEARVALSESLKGKNNVISKKVKIVGRNEIFHGLGEAARWLLSELGIKTTEANIRSNLKRKSKHACGFQWEYVE